MYKKADKRELVYLNPLIISFSFLHKPFSPGNWLMSFAQALIIAECSFSYSK